METRKQQHELRQILKKFRMPKTNGNSICTTHTWWTATVTKQLSRQGKRRNEMECQNVNIWWGELE